MSLPDLLIEPIVRSALLEDLGRAGDLTTDALIGPERTAKAAIVARQPGTVAGVRCAEIAFALMDPAARLTVHAPDGTRVAPGDAVLTVEGKARALLSAERVGLNLACRLSGIATATAALVEAVAGTKAKITCTRKTTPGLRALEKAAVRAGGGANHRFGLDDAVLIKDNHIAVAGGVAIAIETIRARVGHLVKIEVEVDTLDQLREAMPAAPDAVLFDNMGPEALAQAVDIVAGCAITEASGGITLESAPAIAETGVDILSAGWLTHSSKALDLGLDIVVD
ncbi:carboxylating nicotinate-nucleotide diphosphorylase [Amorphus sp. 3PC139-8]|uniref:carboxylating nicotinate-nucleotide diphosphorylase n=1 Tax=Amorphus sp. 3PC139-8 TaxID=2735676 RepID=UPI00345C6608